VEIHCRTCDDIEARVKDLAARLRQSQTEQPTDPKARSEGASS
jgi:hypothetical protein